MIKYLCLAVWYIICFCLGYFIAGPALTALIAVGDVGIVLAVVGLVGFALMLGLLGFYGVEPAVTAWERRRNQ